MVELYVVEVEEVAVVEAEEEDGVGAVDQGALEHNTGAIEDDEGDGDVEEVAEVVVGDDDVDGPDVPEEMVEEAVEVVEYALGMMHDEDEEVVEVDDEMVYFLVGKDMGKTVDRMPIQVASNEEAVEVVHTPYLDLDKHTDVVDVAVVQRHVVAIVTADEVKMTSVVPLAVKKASWTIYPALPLEMRWPVKPH